MTPREYVDRIKTLVAQGRDAEALALAAEHAREVVPRLDADQLNVTSDLLESAQLVVDLAAMGEPAAATPLAGPPGATQRPPGAPQRRTRTARRPV